MNENLGSGSVIVLSRSAVFSDAPFWDRLTAAHLCSPPLRPPMTRHLQSRSVQFASRSVILIFAFLMQADRSERVSAAEVTRPNIIVIYTDDQGYGDVSALNPDAKFKTPNFDRLASEGIAFTNGHSPASVCTPSRYGLLTGRYPWRTTRKQGVMGAEGTCLIEDGRMTLASLLKENGYATGMVGKWHLGMDFPGDPKTRDWSQPTLDMPLDKGFDYYYGVPASLNYGVLAWFDGRHAKVPPTLHTYKKKNRRHLDYRVMPPFDDTPRKPGKGKGTPIDEIAPDFIDNQCLTRFTDKALEWMAQRTKDAKAADAKNRKPFFLYLPFTSPHYPVCPLPEFHGKGDAGGYGEFVIETDHHVGRILDFLKTSGIDRETMIVFTSDNGPEKSWQQRIKEFQHDSRGGYREGKRSVYEGGHRVPFLVRWPGGIAAPGRSWDKPVGQVDLLATFAELLSVPLPENAGEDSDSFATVLLNPVSNASRAPLINHGNGGSLTRYSITDGFWKLVMANGTRPTELYDLQVDPAEKNDVAGKNPERVAQLTNKINQIIARGRTGEGTPQPNDTGYWKELQWMSKQEFDDLAVSH